MREINVRMEYATAPIKNFAIQCPHCECWFRGNDLAKTTFGIGGKAVLYESDIREEQFVCPICKKAFGANTTVSDINIKEVSSEEECFEGCFGMKEIWSK